jgi:hypothetical protein
MKNRVQIVIPVYKMTLTEDESISLSRAFRVFNSYHIDIIAPEDTDMTKYREIAEIEGLQPGFRYFPKKYFEDIFGYNRLMLSPDFYRQFVEFEYILIYQLDAYVFKDELAFWINFGYDYLGAPWISDQNGKLFVGKFAGNGGFSLRRVESFIKTLEINKWIVLRPDQLVQEYSRNGLKFFLRKVPLIVARCIGYKNNSRFYMKTNTQKEDIFWACYAPYVNKKFKSITGQEAIGFAFEKYPSYLFTINRNRLPFGCHGWSRYEPEFWRQFIN